MPEKKLLILGANRYNVLSIRAARAAGFLTLVADRNPGAPGLAEADIALPIDVTACDRILDVLQQKGGVDGIISLSEAGIRSAAYLSARLRLASISEAAAANATSKAAMRRLWASTEFSIEFAEVSSEEEAIEAAARLPVPLIFKPDRSLGGSRGVSRVEAREQVRAAFRFAASSGLPGSSVVIERCIAGSEHSCEVLIHNGECSVLCIGQKTKSEPPYRVDLSVRYPSRLTARQEEVIARMCTNAVSALGLTRGVAHIEFAYTSAGPLLFEIAARCGGGHTPQIAHSVSGVDEFVEACRIACGGNPSNFLPVRRQGADYRFIIFPPGRVASVCIPEEVFRHPGILDVGVTVQAGDEIQAVRSTSDRAGFVVTTARDAAEAAELADWACERIAVQYETGEVSCAMSLQETAS